MQITAGSVHCSVSGRRRASRNSVAVQSFLHHQVQCKQLLQRQDKEVNRLFGTSYHDDGCIQVPIRLPTDRLPRLVHFELRRRLLNQAGLLLSFSLKWGGRGADAHLLCMYTNIQKGHTRSHLRTSVKAQRWPIFQTFLSYTLAFKWPSLPHSDVK